MLRLLLFGALLSQPFQTRWQQLRNQNPRGVTFSIATAKNKYFLGEPIVLELTLAASQPRAFVADMGLPGFSDEYPVDPAGSTEDPARGIPSQSGRVIGGIYPGPVVLSDKPYTVERTLNERVRFLKPGRYRLYVVSHSVRENGGRGAPVAVASNILPLDLEAPPPGWVTQRIAEAARTENPQHAADILRFLDSPEAALAMARRLGSGNDAASYSLHLGVLESPYRAQILPMLEQRLTAPDQPVWDRYLNTICELASLVAKGVPVERKRQEYMARIVASLSAKQPEARAITMATLLGNVPANAPPAWLPGIVAAVTKDFRTLPAPVQGELLGSRWELIRSPAMLPILRDLLDKPQEPRSYLQEIVLDRLAELAPQEARGVILEEIRNPVRGLSWEKLASLPDRHVPELNAVFLEHAGQGRRDDMLILRYATGDIVKPIEEAYRFQRLDTECASPLVFYFLEYDPAFGEQELRRNLAHPGGPPACYDLGFQFQELGRYAMSPALERLAIEYLASPHVPIKRGMAEILGKYGSAAARDPLWKTMEFYRSWWRGRERELEDAPFGPNAQFEQTLVLALGQADGWVLGEADASRLLALCSTQSCKTAASHWAQAARPPIRVEAYTNASGFGARLAQYEAPSLAEFRRRLAQYPRGTEFRLTTPNEAAMQAIREAGQRLAP